MNYVDKTQYPETSYAFIEAVNYELNTLSEDDEGVMHSIRKTGDGYLTLCTTMIDKVQVLTKESTKEQYASVVSLLRGIILSWAGQQGTTDDDSFLELGNTLVKKNINYGDSFSVVADKYGALGITIRFEDKLRRLEQLQDTADLVDESHDDTLFDIAGYAMLTLIYLRRNNPDKMPVAETEVPTVYIGASLLNEGAQLNNILRKGIIESVGFTAHLPQEDASINNKVEAVQEGLAERIVQKDFHAINTADIHLFDVLETTGTTTEIGYIFGRRALAKDILSGIYLAGLDGDSETHADDILDAIVGELERINDTPFIATCSDVRSKSFSSQEGYRREWSINQLLYGVILSLTDGQGFTEDLEEGLAQVKKDMM